MNLDLLRAAKWVKSDFKQTFLSPLHDWEVFGRSVETRVKRIEEQLGDYRPRPVRRVSVAKSSLHIRPASLPTIDDWVLYTAVVEAIAKQVEPSRLLPNRVFSFRYESDMSDGPFKNKHVPYKKFRNRSVKLAGCHSYVVEADISAYFENIDLGHLRRTLLSLGAEQELVDYLEQKLLMHWVHTSGRGIPQGPWASSYLGSIYLDKVDKAIVQHGFEFVRYVDDIRIFCKSKTEARMAIHKLTDLVRELGLGIQTSKTYIRTSEEALVQYEGFGAVLEDLKEDVRNELIEAYDLFGPYAEFDVEEGDQDPEPSEVTLQALRRLFDDLVGKKAATIDRHGLRFVVNRLTLFSDDYGLDFLLREIESLCDVTVELTSYFKKFSEREMVQRAIAKFLLSEECILDWQAMHLVKCLEEVEELSCQEMIDYAFNIVRDRNRHFALRVVCTDFLGRHAERVIIEELRRLFGEEFSPEVQVALVLACRRLHREEREKFLSGCRRINQDLDSAVSICVEG